MATDRLIACVYYECEHSCLKGREGTFRDACQTCKKYVPRKGSRLTHQNLKKKKAERIKELDMKQMIQDY